MFTTPGGRLQPVWGFVLSALLSAVAFYVCATASSAIAGDHVLLSELLFRPLLVLVLISIFNWLLATADHVEEHRLAAMGLPWTAGVLRQFVTGGLLGMILVVLAVVPMSLWGGGLTVDLHTTSRTLPRVVAVLIILLSGSLAEELMFRGYPFQRLQEAIGAVAAIAVFSVLFAAVHLLNPWESVWGLANTILIGIVLATAYLRSRGLWVPWGIHFAWNATLGLVFGLPVSGLRIFNVIIRTTARGPHWLTGGAYGIEASATGAVVVLLGFVVVWKAPIKALEALPRPPELMSADGPSGI